MPKKKRLDPNSQGYTNALLEDVDSKLEAVLEVTAPISGMQQDIKGTQADVKNMQQSIGNLQADMKEVLTWEDSIKLIPAIFEEVGALRKEVEVLKEAMQLLDKHDTRLDSIEQRLKVVESMVFPYFLSDMHFINVTLIRKNGRFLK